MRENFLRRKETKRLDSDIRSIGANPPKDNQPAKVKPIAIIVDDCSSGWMQKLVKPVSNLKPLRILPLFCQVPPQFESDQNT